ncbi:MAG: hypothetical protein AB1499_16620 [Nitrospirota bacterium]
MNHDGISYLVQKGIAWINDQRNRYYSISQELSGSDKNLLIAHFDAVLLNAARLSYVEYIENPPFYPELAQLGIRNLVDFTSMDGITFGDCILVSRRVPFNQQTWTSLLFHEMVHVTQYSLLGTQRFAELYVIGWAQNGFVYENIPLERQAYMLQSQFEQGELRLSVSQYLKQQFRYV